jgi:hypothetical protein
MKVVLISLVLINMAWAESNDHHSKHGKKEARAETVDRKFKTTNDLKIRMDKIVKITNEIAALKLDSAKAKIVGEKIEVTVNDIFKTCKLPPAADEAIHPILGSILEGADDLKQGKITQGHDRIHHAILNYEKIFSLK